MPDLTELRDAVAALRAAVQVGLDAERDALAWLYCTADWPLLGSELPEDPPERRVELIELDDLRDDPRWADRRRIERYAQPRFLSLRLLGLDGGPIGIELGVLPSLAYLSLAENVLTRVPPEVRACTALVHLSLRKNRLASIDPGELPRALRWLDVGEHPLPSSTIARLREALPACHVVSDLSART